MDNKIYYQVRGTLYRHKGDETDLIQIDETFENVDPIVARKQAFSHYQSYIDVLLQSTGKEYLSHKETVVELQDFVKSGIKHKLLPDDIDMDAGIGLNIYMMKKVPEPFTNMFGEIDYRDAWRIHYIDCQNEDWSTSILQALVFESYIYEKNEYECRYHAVICDTLSHFKERTIKIILKTPLFMGW